MHSFMARHCDVRTVKQIQITYTKLIEEQTKKTLGVRINQKKSNVFHEKGDHDGKFPMDRRVKFSIAKEKHTIMENAQM